MNASDNFVRYSFVGAFLCILPVIMVLRLVQLQVDPVMRDKFIKQKEYLANPEIELAPPRGQIYDRNGNLLAGNKLVYSVGLTLGDDVNPHNIADALVRVVGVTNYQEILDAAAGVYAKPGTVHVNLVNNVTPKQYEQLKSLQEQMWDKYDPGDENSPTLEGMTFTPYLARIYPEKTLGSNMLGFVDYKNKGIYGIEGKFNDLLVGKTVKEIAPNSPVEADRLPQTPAGSSLVLTIDREIQQAMEDLIDDSVAESGSASGTLVVIEPKTGEVLAMATTPRIDLNRYWDIEEVFPETNLFNRAISQPYEPGSVFKVFTMASALDLGAVTPDTVFVDTGSIYVGGAHIINWNGGAWGPQTMTGCLQHSLNVCLAWIATQVGPNNLYHHLQTFGIGRYSGIDLDGEAPGRLKAPDDGDWSEADLGTNSFGQGVTATPLQMAIGISAVANNGTLMAPKVVRAVVNEGYQYTLEPRVVGQPIRPEIARTLTDMLAESLEIESSDALVTGYRVAGKTGTAEIPVPGLGYSSNLTNASFVGWGPVDDPQFLVYVWLEKPTTSPWGSVVAAPVFRQAVEQLVILLDLPPDDVRRQLNGN